MIPINYTIAEIFYLKKITSFSVFSLRHEFEVCHKSLQLEPPQVCRKYLIGNEIQMIAQSKPHRLLQKHLTSKTAANMSGSNFSQKLFSNPSICPR